VILESEVIMLRRKIEDAAEARACLAAAKASRQKRADWARAHGIDARSLNAWRLNLERAAVQPTELRLVELVPTRAHHARARYSVRVADMVIEVDDAFDDDVLRRLISVVASC
jgi:hypothetical protein